MDQHAKLNREAGRLTGFIFILFAAAVLILFSFQTASAQNTSEDISPDMLDALLPGSNYSLGSIIEPFSAQSLSGKTINLENYIGKKTTVLVFWLNSCSLCYDEMKLLADVIKKRKLENKIAVITIVRAKDKYEKLSISKHYATLKLPWPVILDPELKIAKRFNIAIVPSFLLIDKNGRMATQPVFRIKKPLREMNFEDFILSTEKGKKIPPNQFRKPTDDDHLKNLISKAAPAFSLKTIDGAPFSSATVLKKKNTVLVFWHPDHPPAASAMTQIADYSSAFSKKMNFQVIGLASLYGLKQLKSAKSFRDEKNIPFPLLVDDESKTGNKYSVINSPTIFVVGKDGKISDVISEKSKDIIGDLDSALKSMK